MPTTKLSNAEIKIQDKLFQERRRKHYEQMARNILKEKEARANAQEKAIQAIYLHNEEPKEKRDERRKQMQESLKRNRAHWAAEYAAERQQRSSVKTRAQSKRPGGGMGLFSAQAGGVSRWEERQKQ